MGDGGTVMVRKDLGLLDRVFSNADLSTLSGQNAVRIAECVERLLRDR